MYHLTTTRHTSRESHCLCKVEKDEMSEGSDKLLESKMIPPYGHFVC